MIRDVIGGFFVLAEDQYGVGDDVDLGRASGSVERITLRSAQLLRDGDGRVWYVPHGGVVRVANLSKSAQAAITLEVDPRPRWRRSKRGRRSCATSSPRIPWRRRCSPASRG